MRVIFFIGEFNEGGAERVISILANKMIEVNFDIEILKYHNTENFYKLNKNIKVTSVESHTHTRTNTLKNISWMKKYFKENADIIISFLAPFNILAIMAHGNVPIIVADRNDPRFIPTSKFRRILRDYLYKYADKIVVQTKNNKEYFSKRVQDKTEIIFNPIDIKDDIGLALKTKKENLIVSVSRLEKQKNQDMLIDVFYKLQKKYPDYKLIIYGEGSYRKELENKINSLKLNDKVLLPGNKKDILNKMAKAKIYVCSSNYEGMSNSLIEALSIGLPVVSTKVSGTEDLIDDGINGLLVDVNDADALLEKIEYLLDNDDAANTLSKEATKVVSKLNTDMIVNKWIDIINSIIK